MKQINFSELRIEVAIGEFKLVDVRKELGNLVFSSAVTLEDDTLARKIFGAPSGIVEYSDEEIERLLSVLRSKEAKYSVIKAIECASDDSINMKNKKKHGNSKNDKAGNN